MPGAAGADRLGEASPAAELASISPAFTAATASGFDVKYDEIACA